MAIAGKWARANARQRTGCRSGVPWPGQALGVLDHRQFGRVFVLSIGETCHEATTAPVSNGAWKAIAGKWARAKARSAPAADRGCRGLWLWCRGVGKPRLPLAWPVLAALDHRQFFRGFVLSIGEAGNKATTAPGSSGAWWRSPASGPGRRRDSVPAADRACRGLLRLSGCSQASVAGVRQGCLRRGPCWRCSIIGSSAGPSFSRSVKPATRRRRRQGRAVPGGDRRQVGQVEGETAYRLPIGVAVAWSGSRGAGNPWLPLAWPVLAVLDHRQFFRAFVLSIGEAAHEATTAPGSSGAWWRSPASGARSKARQRTGCRSGVPWPGQALGVLAGFGCRRAPGLPLAWPVLAALDHRQFGRSFVLSIGEAGHEATTAPGSNGAWWRSPTSGPGRRRDSVPAADRACRGLLRLSGVLDHRQFGRVFVLSIGEAGHEATTAPGSSGAWKAIAGKWARAKARQRTGCRSGVPWPGQALGVLAGFGCRRAPGLPLAWPVLAALDHRQFGRSFVLSIGEAGHEATTAPGSNGAWWRSPTSGPGRRRDSVPAADRACRGLLRLSGCSITGSSAGSSSSRSVKPPTRRRRRQGRAVPGGDRRQVGQGEGETAHRLPIGRAVACSGSRGARRHRLQACARVASGVARAGGARSSAVRPGLRSLDR
ncbi:MAG: hypothetical protein IPK44_10325 [Candidatus Accumulibacter sp.]|uniref:hypothetical protein n=1 Tax=Accumulibacter sp. TaxID=2053492 RepID=UPI00258A0B24|nr:hypothetical protein [Accumulibacter sp.]MBK8114898.1 hypothetical protein [Accumulibacter sp.]